MNAPVWSLLSLRGRRGWSFGVTLHLVDGPVEPHADTLHKPLCGGQAGRCDGTSGQAFDRCQRCLAAAERRGIPVPPTSL